MASFDGLGKSGIGTVERAMRRGGRVGVIAGALAIAALTASDALAVNHPFGSHPMTYASGTIRPNHVTQGVLDEAVRDFYDAWKDEYLEQTCGAGRFVVRASAGGGNLTVSEAHGYGMMILALMAGHDPDARTLFDGMYAYFRDHPTTNHDDLMAWNQNNSCQDAGGVNSATDGDLDIAYALLLADKQWGNCGAIDYEAQAETVLEDILEGDVDASASYTLLGDWVTPSSTQYYPSTRTSDFMLGHFKSYAAATGETDWTGLVDSLYDVVDELQTDDAPSTGLLPDFAVNPATTPEPAPAGFLEGANDGAYNYNACRTPWRIGTDFVVSGDTRAHTAAQRINTWIKDSTAGDPEEIRSGYALSGTPLAGTDYLSMAFIGPFGVGAMVDSSNQAWLNAIWDLVTETPIGAEHYYENTIKLLTMIVMSGNWWAPQTVSGGCAPSTGTDLCTGPALLSNADVTIKKVGAPLGDEILRVRGSLFFSGGIPVPSLDVGAQILVEDLGSGGAAVYELTTETTPVPPSSVTECDPREGWVVSSMKTQYRNRSGALDPPACTAGSAEGLSKLLYKKRSTQELELGLDAKGASIGPVVGPVRATLVLGDDEAAGDAGRCGVSVAIPCFANGAGTTVRCR